MFTVYASKEDFIKDFLRECRKYKKSFSFYHAFFPQIEIETELWSFEIYIHRGRVSTKPIFFWSTLSPYAQSVYYPLTEWGGNKIRWDTELKEFLEREICKI